MLKPCEIFFASFWVSFWVCMYCMLVRSTSYSKPLQRFPQNLAHILVGAKNGELDTTLAQNMLENCQIFSKILEIYVPGIF